MASRIEQAIAEQKRRKEQSRLGQIMEEQLRRSQVRVQPSIRAAPSKRVLPEITPSGLEKVAAFTEKLPILPIAGSIVGEAVLGKFRPAAKLIDLGLRSFGSGAGGIGGLFAEEAARGEFPTTGEIIGEGIAGTTAPGLGGVTKRAFRPVRTLFEPFLSGLSPGARVVNDNLKRYGENLMFSQATTSRVFNVAENVARAALTSVSPMERKLVRQAVATERFADDVLGRFLSKPRTNAEIGNIFTTAHAAKENFNKRIAEESYKILDELSGNAQVVDFGKIASFLPGKSQKAISLFNSTVRNRKINITQLRDARGKFLPGKGILFSDAKKIRTDYLELGRRLRSKNSISPTEMAEINQVINAIDTQMKSAAQKGRYLEQFEIINRNYAKFREDFHNDFIKGLVREEPSIIGQKVANIKTPEDVRRLKRAVTPNTMEHIRGAYLSNLAERASGVTKGLEERGTRQLLGKKLKDILKLNKVEKEMRDELLEAGAEKNLRLLADQAFLVGEKQSAGLGAMAVQLTQARAVAGVGAGVAGIITGNPATGLFIGGMIFLGPVGLQRLLTSKKGMALLLEGLPLETGTSEGVKIATRIALFLGVPREEGITFQDVVSHLEQKRLQAINPRLPLTQTRR